MGDQRPASDQSQLVEALRERIEGLEGEVRYLREQLDQEREARTEERRRQDTLLAQLTAANAEQARTIRSIEGPQERQESPQESAEAA